MNGPAPVKPLRFIVEASIPQLHELVQPLLAWLTPRGQPSASRETNDQNDEEDADEPEERTADPPAVNLPPAVADIPAGYTLGPLCPRNHRRQGTRQTLRRSSNNKCRECVRVSDQRRKAAKPSVATPVLVSQAGDRRPELPSHWEGRGFLSPVLCTEPTHRYRDSAYTLRYVDSELCVQCCTDANPALALAGD